MTHRPTREISLVVSLLLVLTAGACTSDPGTDTPTPSEADRERVTEVSTPVTRVAGRLSDADRLALRRDVEGVLRRYVDSAFLDPDATPRTAFPGFTEGGERLARTQAATLSRGDLRGADVRARRLGGTVDAFAPAGQARGATLHLDLVLDATRGDRTRRVRLTGRMLLTPVGDAWRVFGFDVRRSER